MRTVTWALLLAMLVMVMPAVAQEEARAAGEVPAMPKDMAERMERFKQMGMDEGAALFMTILTSSGMDPAQLILLMALMDKGGGGGDDAIGLMLLMNAMGGKQEGKQPVVLDRGETLLIIEDGVLYVVNLDTMELEGSVPYAEAPQADAATMMAILAPVIARAKEKAQQTSCLSNLRQLGTAFAMYRADHDGTHPKENWAEEIYAYVNNEQVYTCPSRPDLPVAYAMNQKLLGAKEGDIKRPAETILLFESNLGGDSPVGFPVDVPEEGVHNGGIMCGFVDGHVKWLPVAEARELLEEDPFE